jgi:hypothetical protein
VGAQGHRNRDKQEEAGKVSRVKTVEGEGKLTENHHKSPKNGQKRTFRRAR